jgi:hypothetical protein
MMITCKWLRDNGACWSDQKIEAMGVTEMSAADLVSDTRVSWGDKQWVISRLLFEQSDKVMESYAKHCINSAEQHAMSDIGECTQYYARAAARSFNLSGPIVAELAAVYAAHAASCTQQAANYRATSQAAEHRKNLAFALTLLTAGAAHV